jgi:hypothetical protein
MAMDIYLSVNEQACHRDVDLVRVARGAIRGSLLNAALLSLNHAMFSAFGRC